MTAQQLVRRSAALVTVVLVVAGASCVPDDGGAPTTTTTTTTTLPPLGPFQPTVLDIWSDPGDYIGQGLHRRYTSADGTFGTSGGGARINGGFVSSTDPSDVWPVAFEAPIGRQLVPGSYEHAVRATGAGSDAPSLSIFHGSHGCNLISGRFDVREVATDRNGLVTRFAVDFEQRCDSSSGVLRGSFHWNASSPGLGDGDADTVNDEVDNCPSIPNPAQTDRDHDHVGNACDDGDDPTWLHYESDVGDYIGAGLTRTWSPTDRRFNGAASSDRRIASISVLELDANITQWQVWFQAPSGALAPGTYDGATRFGDGGTPGLQVSGEGRGCNTLTGSFTVHTVAWDAAGALASLSADFVQHCEGQPRALRGQVRYNATAL